MSHSVQNAVPVMGVPTSMTDTLGHQFESAELSQSLSPRPPPAFVPHDTLSQLVYQHVATHLAPDILNHSLRVFLYARSLARHDTGLDVLREKSSDTSLQDPILFAISLFHDMGTAHVCNTGPTRFEVEGADAALRLLATSQDLRSHLSAEDRRAIWMAIALHTSPHIAERIHPLARVLRQAVRIDFHGAHERALLNTALQSGPRSGEAEIARVEALLPRGNIEKVLAEAIVAQSLESPGKAPAATWPGALLRSKQEFPAWEGINKAF